MFSIGAASDKGHGLLAQEGNGTGKSMLTEKRRRGTARFSCTNYNDARRNVIAHVLTGETALSAYHGTPRQCRAYP
jgi:hypothetical protein